MTTLSVPDKEVAEMRKRFRITKAEGEVHKGGYKPEKVFVVGNGALALAEAVARKLGELVPADALAEAVIEKAKKELAGNAAAVAVGGKPGDVPEFKPVPIHSTVMVDRNEKGAVRKESWKDKKSGELKVRWWTHNSEDQWVLCTSLSDARAKIGKVIVHPEILTKKRDDYALKSKGSTQQSKKK